MSGHFYPHRHNVPPGEEDNGASPLVAHWNPAEHQQPSAEVFGHGIVSMEDISNQLEGMCVDDLDHGGTANRPSVNSGNNNHIELNDNEQQQHHQLINDEDNIMDCFMDSSEDYHHQKLHGGYRLTSSDLSSSLMTDDDDTSVDGVMATDGAHTEHSSQEVSNILVVTNVNSVLFNDEQLKKKFESIFIANDPNVTFRYLKSFRRVRLDFTTPEQAEAARFTYNSLDFDSASKCYAVQMIKSSQASNSSHLLPPKPTRQFLISPPASPPVGWEPVSENSPCINVQLISALANLVPGRAHLIHEATESQPGIVVEVCDDLRMQADRFDELKPIKQVTRIAPTARPF